jgi:hypothetical protein
MQPFTVFEIVEGKSVRPYIVVEGGPLIEAVRISQHDVAGQAERVSAEIGWWSRLHAQAERVAQFAEREYAIWKAAFRLEHAGVVLESTGKRPTIAQLEDLYRTADGYRTQNAFLEEAKEAAASARGVVDAFKAKRDIISRELYRANDESLRRITG